MGRSNHAATRRFLLVTSVVTALAFAMRPSTSNETAEPVTPVDPQYAAVAQYISPEAWDEMVPFQRQMLVNLANRRAESDAALAGKRKRPSLVACWEYGGEPMGREIEYAFNTVAPNGDLDAFRLRGTFWEETATDGPGLVRGDQMTFTWGFVADGLSIPGFNGEPTSNSNLIAFLDTLYDPGHTGGADLTQRLWFARFQQVFTVWSAKIGTEYVYEPNDDGAAFMTAPGVLGVRADMRVSGHFIDGEVGTNILAYNFYPHVGGDMVIDTGNPTFFGDGTNNSRGLRNVLAHEHGHGIGLAHVCSTDREFLMEPFINVTFDGPQEDDILGAHRLYGEPSEFPDGNDSAADYDARFAVSAGHNFTVIATGGIWGIDGTSDVDVFAFDLLDPDSLLTISVVPYGSTYDEGPQVGNTCTSNGPFNAAAQNDLVLELIEFDGTPIVTADANGAGSGETISNFPIASPGLVYYRVSGNIDAAQRYDWNFSVVADPAASPPLPAAPAAADGFVRLTTVRGANGGTLVLGAKLDFGGGSVDLSQASTFQYGTKTLNLAAGALNEFRPGLWRWRSADRKKLLTIREPRDDSSSGLLSYREKGHTDTLPGGNQFHTQFTRGAFDVVADVLVVGGQYRSGQQPGTNAPLTVTNFTASAPAGADNDSFSLVAEFPSDMVVPGTEPDIIVRVGQPGAVFEAMVPSTASVASAYGSRGYRYRAPDPDGLGPLQPQGLWYVVVDYTRRTVRAFARDVNLGAFPVGSAPVYISVKVGAAPEAAVEIRAQNTNTAADPVLRYR